MLFAQRELDPIQFFIYEHIRALARENLFSGFAINKGADQPAHPRRLISAFVIRLLESIMSRLATREISIFQLVSVVERAGWSLGLPETP